MKTIKLLLLAICLLCNLQISAQECPEYPRLLQEGDNALAKDDFKTALNSYFAARSHCRGEIGTIRQKIENVYNEIENLKSRLVACEQNVRQVDKLENEIQGLEIDKQKQEQKHGKLDDIFYIEKYGKYGFYDKDSGREILGGYIYGSVNKINLCDINLCEKEFYIAKKGNESYLVDFNGKLYPYSDNIADLNPNTTALVIENSDLGDFTDEIFQNIQLEILILKDTEITALPNSIGNMKKLKILDIRDNKLTTIPNTIGSLYQLEILNLSKNKIHTVPPEIWNLQNMSHLSLASNNQITTLPAGISNLNKLKILSLNGNHISSLPEDICHLKQLETLNLGGNKLASLPQDISRLVTLQVLDLYENKFSSGEKERIKTLLPNCDVLE